MEKTIYAEDYRSLLFWLRKLRRERKLTMRELASRLGVHHSWIGRIESGERRLDVAEFVRLCNELGGNPNDGLSLLRNDPEPVRKVAEKKVRHSGRRKNGGSLESRVRPG